MAHGLTPGLVRFVEVGISFWWIGDNPDYAFNDVVDIGEVASHFPVVENFDGFIVQNGLCK